MLETHCFIIIFPREPDVLSLGEQVDRLAAQMSLEAAAKELEKLEIQMHKRESNVSAGGSLQWVRNKLPQ